MKKITMQVIADKLGVSKALVSKALANDPAVSDTTRELIWHTAEHMGYRIKSVKKASSFANTRNVAVLMPRAYVDDFEYWGKIISGIDKELADHGYSMILSGIDLLSPPHEGLPPSIKDEKVDGALVLGHVPQSYVMAIQSKRIPFVVVDSYVLDPTVDHVLANNFLGAYQATNYLLAAGHRHIGFVGDLETAWSFRERGRGYEEAIYVHNMDSADKATTHWIGGMGVSGEGNYKLPHFEDLLKEIVSGDSQVTGIFCGNDMLAFEVLRLLSQWNIKCPEDVSVIGFDDLSLTEFMNPKLTTVRVPKESIGARAVQSLFRRIETPDRHAEHVHISTELVHRLSVQKFIGNSR